MVNFASVARHIDKGDGKAGKKLGQPFSAYRIGSSSSGDFPTGWSQIQSGFPLFQRKYTSESKTPMGVTKAVQWFELIGNMSLFHLGDCFVMTDASFVPGKSYGAGATSIPNTIQIVGYCFAWHAPVAKRIGAWLDRRARIYRPASAPQIQSDGSSYWASTFDNDQPLILSGGKYTFGTAGAGGASFVPISLMTVHRNSETVFAPPVPGNIKPSRWSAYLPPLPGYWPNEGDALVCEDGTRLVVTSPYVQEVGIVGSQMLVDRKISANATPTGG